LVSSPLPVSPDFPDISDWTMFQNCGSETEENN
jgi:hypothetical protein